MTLRLTGALALAVVLAAGGPAHAQRPAGPVTRVTSSITPRDTQLTVTLITFGLGHEVFERFGHNALWFHDPRVGMDVAYHWGLFDFNDPDFLVRFLTGDTRYAMGPVDPFLLMDYERRAGRPFTLQKLRLSADQAQRLQQFVRWNERPENRYYRYDYFRDNCSTRLRDALDRVLGGALRTRSDTVLTSLTYRSESLRLTDGDRPAQAGIDIALGRPADEPITRWQSFFIPMRLRDDLRDTRIADSAGVAQPLVLEERAVEPYPGTTVERELSEVPHLTLRYLAVSVVLALLVVGLRIMSISRRGAAWGLSLFGAAWWLTCGLVGVIVFLAWTATRHVFWSWNENLLLLTPFCLVLAVLTPLALLRGRALRAARAMSGGAVLCGLLALALALVPGGQASGAVVALILPVHLALAWALGLQVPARQTPRA